MPERAVRSLGLPLQENDDIVIRTATNEIRAIRHCTFFDLNVSEVVAQVRVYVVDIPQSYSLLLGRHWLYQVRALEKHARNTCIIYDSEGYPHTVIPTSDQIDNLPKVMLNPDN